MIMKSSTALRESSSAQLIFFRLIIYVVLIFLSALAVVPIWLVIINATRSSVEIRTSLSFLPSTHLAQNWRFLEGSGTGMLQGYQNSIFVSVSASVLTVYFSMMTAYALEVYNFKIKDIFRRFIYLLVLIPMGVSVMGFYQYMARLGLVNTYIPLIIPAIAAPPNVFFAEQYLKTSLVKDLIYSARIDGCSELGIFHRIMLPMAKPGIFTLLIFQLIFNWNSFLLPAMIITSRSRYTVPLVVRQLEGDTYRTEIGAVFLGITLSLFPIIFIYTLLSKQIVGGLTLGALKE